jgi:predicted RNA-binding protein with PUA-like domain
MPQYWLLKTEPSEFSFDQLMRERRTVWNGVSNNAALKHMRSMKQGDRTFIYHSGEEKAVVGVAEVLSDPYPDPHEADPKLVVVDIRATRRLNKAVSLKAIKSDKRFAQFELVRISRLSVMPVSKSIWDAIENMSKKEQE